ncbi:DNA-directed RNA polymerase I subunit RPA34 isoform X3 [Biomphalaria pfeifferi]|uniref:DNA-directed RNA polymerase I subunit RPA34 isoform X3 n=1 Tax=Biomphalaria pfeifferi TaxID=112525 RepID=A0AAD8BYN2_BIOPF|nr:DNA-directed RNA polymerase I subunit RPA34 isoform X3 [Biomphalaria pfeifferi]
MSVSYKLPENFKEIEPGNIKINEDDEVYLLRVPKGYDISKINGMEFIPNQITEIEEKEEQNKLISVYELSSFAQQPQDILPIIKNKDKVTLGPQINGILNVSKSYKLPPSTLLSELDSTQNKHVTMPEGLRPRFVPFGSGTPHKVIKSRKKKRKRSSIVPTYLEACSESLVDSSGNHKRKKVKPQNTFVELSIKKEQVKVEESLDNSHDKEDTHIHKKKKKKKKIKTEEMF